jgi:hypothetical protein
MPVFNERATVETALERLLAADVQVDRFGIYEVPITYRARRREEGKKLTAVDGVRVLATLARCRVR